MVSPALSLFPSLSDVCVFISHGQFPSAAFIYLFILQNSKRTHVTLFKSPFPPFSFFMEIGGK